MINSSWLKNYDADYKSIISPNKLDENKTIGTVNRVENVDGDKIYCTSNGLYKFGIPAKEKTNRYYLWGKDQTTVLENKNIVSCQKANGGYYYAFEKQGNTIILWQYNSNKDSQGKYTNDWKQLNLASLLSINDISQITWNAPFLYSDSGNNIYFMYMYNNDEYWVKIIDDVTKKISVSNIDYNHHDMQGKTSIFLNREVEKFSITSERKVLLKLKHLTSSYDAENTVYFSEMPNETNYFLDILDSSVLNNNQILKNKDDSNLPVSEISYVDFDNSGSLWASYNWDAASTFPWAIKYGSLSTINSTLDSDKWNTYSSKNNLSKNIISYADNLFIDNQGNLWVVFVDTYTRQNSFLNILWSGSSSFASYYMDQSFKDFDFLNIQNTFAKGTDASDGTNKYYVWVTQLDKPASSQYLLTFNPGKSDWKEIGPAKNRPNLGLILGLSLGLSIPSLIAAGFLINIYLKKNKRKKLIANEDII